MPTTTRSNQKTVSQVPWSQVALGAAATCFAATSYLLWSKRAIRSDDFFFSSDWKFFAGDLMAIKENITRLHDYRSDIILSQNGEIVAFSILGDTPILYLNTPQLIEYVYTQHHEHLTRGGSFTRLKSREMFGDGIFNTDRPGWKKQRKIASRLLTMRNLKYTMFESFKDVSQRMCDKMSSMNSENEEERVSFDMFDIFNRVTMDGFVTSAFGIESKNVESYPNETQFATSFNRGMRLLLERYILRGWYWQLAKTLDIGDEKTLREDSTFLRNMIDDVIRQNRENAAKGRDNKKCDLLSLFMESYSEADSQMIQDVCLNFIIAGRDTTGTLLSWCLYELCLNPDILEKVREEIDRMNDITYENVKTMTFTESVLLETLRLHPSVPASNTMYVDKDIPLPDGRVIPTNWKVGINNYALGRAPWLYEDPLRFDPSRFKDGVNSVDPTFFPAFSVAPRLCLGRGVALMESKVCLWYFLKHFNVEMVPDQEITYEFNIILVMKNGLKVYVSERD